MIHAILMIGAMFLNIAEAPEIYSVDKDASTVTWKAEKVTGGHTGTIQIKEGGLTYEDGTLTGGTFVIDMTTIKTNENLPKLENHLRSDDFFSVEKFPSATFKITEAIDQGPRGYNITGDITIKGITKQIKFVANTEETNSGINAKADLVIDRSEFDVKYGSGSFFDDLGDKMIYDNFNLSVSIVTKK